MGTKTTIGAYQDGAALRAFAQSVDVITFEFENIPAETLEMLDYITAVRPKPSVLFTTRHRLREKEFIRALAIATAPFAPVRSEAELAAALKDIGAPSVLKTTELGYDGKGQVVIKNVADGARAWASLGKTQCVLEKFITFSAEASVIVARSTTGEARCYPLVENIHRNHILHRTIAPATFIDQHQAEATRIAKTLAEALDVVGLLAVELFVTVDGLLVNELAPRPHNSGHWSMEGAPTSQFEQHIRAICGWALGDTSAIRPCEMINLLGDDWLQWQEYAKQPEAHVHLYGKTESRPGRKMGHVTLVKR